MRFLYSITICLLLSGPTFSQKGDTAAIKNILSKSNDELNDANYETAYSLVLIAIKEAEANPNEKWLGECYWQCGIILEKLGKADQSINYYNRGISIAKKINLPRLEAKCNHSAGWSYYLQGSYDMALKKYLAAVKLREGTRDSVPLAWTINNIGLIYWQQHNHDKAIENFLEAHKIFEKKNSLGGLAIATNNIGLIYEEKKDYNMALLYYKESYQQNVKAESKSGISLTLNNIGGIFMMKGDLDSAEWYSKKALNINLEIKHLEGLQLNYLTLAEIAKKRKDYDKALMNIERSISVCLEGKFPDGLINSYKLMAEVFSDQGDYKSAYEAHKQFALYNDSLNFGDKITDMEAKFQKEKSEKEISLLKKEREISELELKRKQWMIYSAVAGALLLLGVVGLLIRTGIHRKKINIELEQKNTEVIRQKEIVELKQKEIVASIYYASRIQNALLTSENYFKTRLNDFFILYKPKDIVSGDFYWALEHKGIFYLIVADCTGHGVPGAFMSLLNISVLNEVIIERGIVQPDQILNETRKEIIRSLNPDGGDVSKDGMDCILCAIDIKNKKLKYTGANNFFYLLRDGEIIISQTDKMPVGLTHKERPFTLHEIDLKENDRLYLVTDGFADQFGGPKGKKFKYKQLQQLILNNGSSSMEKQKELLDKEIENWRGNLEQVDDICIAGIKI